MTYFILFLAILAEVVATTALKASDSFTKLVPTVIFVVGYGFSFYLVDHCYALNANLCDLRYLVWFGCRIDFIVWLFFCA